MFVDTTLTLREILRNASPAERVLIVAWLLGDDSAEEAVAAILDKVRTRLQSDEQARYRWVDDRTGQVDV